MPRLIDALREKECRLQKPWCVAPHYEQKWAAHGRVLWPFLEPSGLPVILIDNVASYMLTGTDQEYWDLEKHFPNMSPPFSACWFEYKMPTKVHSKERGDTDLSNVIPHGRCGLLMFAPGRDEVTLAPDSDDELPESVKWVLTFEMFLDLGERNCTAQGPHGTWFVFIDAEGQIVNTPLFQGFHEPEQTQVVQDMMTFIHPALLAISFMHCKNVTLEHNEVPPKLAKKYERNHGVKPTAYKTLVIEPLKEILRREGRSGEVGLQKAMHICRGHFKDYRQGAGLFGKYHQLVWHPSVVRGSKKGEVPPREIEVRVPVKVK